MNPISTPSLGTVLSTTLPYVNAEPHVGFALELAQTDALARALRLFGEPVRTCTGTDEHSLKNLRSAAALGVPVHELVTSNAAAFAELASALEADFDANVATSRDPAHGASVERLFLACAESGDVYRRRYSGAYCVGCEAFYDTSELPSGLCPEHLCALERVEEDNWFFRLSRYTEPLVRLLESGALRVLPEQRKNEVLGFLARGLEDISISRPAARAHGFGVCVPGDPTQVIYVWFDALAGYLSAGEFARLGPECAWQRAAQRVHVLGKGVLRFHAVYWPAFLLSAGLAPPTELRVHGYLTVEGRKIGKSLGNAVDPSELIRQYGASALRYYLLAHVSPFKDADFSREALVRVHDNEVANELGNLLRRTVTLVHRLAGGRVPHSGASSDAEHALALLAAELPGKVREAVQRHEFAEALAHIWQVVRASNRTLEAAAPWSVAKLPDSAAKEARLAAILSSCLGALHCIALTLSPFLPALAASLARALGVALDPRAFAGSDCVPPLPVGAQLPPVTLLAPRLGAPLRTK